MIETITPPAELVVLALKGQKYKIEKLLER